jgi:toxin ParE1/3/4
VTELRFSERAEHDLVEIGAFIVRDNPVAAAQLIARLEQHCSLLALHPLLGRARDALIPGLRSLAYGRYVIFYRAIEDGAETVRVLHGARDFWRVLRGGELQ